MPPDQCNIVPLKGTRYR
uniref:Uncharacterized protein n=1 Tax=Arundo donax TaxID=35708 RepID=A0A0A9BVC8_ARUDO